MIKNVLYFSLAFFAFSSYAQEKKPNQEPLKKNDSKKEILTNQSMKDTLKIMESKDLPIKQLKPKRDFLVERNR